MWGTSITYEHHTFHTQPSLCGRLLADKWHRGELGDRRWWPLARDTHCPRVKPMNLFLLASRKCSMSFCLMEQQRNEIKEENAHISELLRKSMVQDKKLLAF